MTQVFKEDGSVVPVTRVKAGPCVVTQVKTKTKDGVNAVQIGYGDQKVFRLNKAQRGHLKDLAAKKDLREVNTGDTELSLKRGDEFTVQTFEKGEKVQVTGRSKGKGFQGVVRRHGFAGSPASHGHKDQLRMPGSIGATDAARVFKGTRMAGQMGDGQVTVKNLEIIEINETENELLIKGAVPGARGGLIMLLTNEGDIQVKLDVKEEEKVEEKTEKVEEVVSTEEKKEKVTADEDEKVEEKVEKSNEEAAPEAVEEEAK